MNLVFKIFYKYLFYISYSTSVIFILISVLFALQIKFAMFGNFLSDILEFFDLNSFAFTLIHGTDGRKSYTFNVNIIFTLVKQFWILMSVFFMNFVLMFFNLLKKKTLVFISTSLIIISIILLLINVETSILCSISIIFSSYSLFIFLNYILSKKKFPKILLLLPIINISIVSVISLQFFNNKIRKVLIIFSTIGLTIFQLLCVAFINNYDDFITKFFNKEGNFYCIRTNFDDDSLIFNEVISHIMFFEYTTDNNYSISYFNKDNIEESCFKNEEIKINRERNEIYMFNTNTQTLFVLDKNFNKIKKKKISMEKSCCNERISFDNKSGTILIISEGDTGALLLNMDSLNILRKIEIKNSNDGVVYNSINNSYVCSFWANHDIFVEIPVDLNKPVKEIKSFFYQGYVAFSRRNKEIYIAFYHQGRIGVYDAQTYEFKRFIQSNYMVKNITYNEELNVLFAPSYLTGYFDIFLMDGTDSLIYRKFICFEPREIYYNIKHKEIFCCSSKGVKFFKLDIENLIEKYGKK